MIDNSKNRYLFCENHRRCADYSWLLSTVWTVWKNLSDGYCSSISNKTRLHEYELAVSKLNDHVRLHGELKIDWRKMCGWLECSTNGINFNFIQNCL